MTTQPGSDDAARTRWLTPDLAICLLLVSVPWMLFGDVVKLWWTFDDAFHLRYAMQHTPRDYLFDPAAWTTMQRLFTPLLVVSYETDLKLWGVDATAFYYRHLVELTAFVLLLFLTLRQWLGRFASTSAVLLLFLGAPFTEWASQLMVRHYVESCIAACVATLLWVRAVRRDAARDAWLAGAAYFVAICAKEISVPLPAILLLLPEGPWRARIRSLVPMGIALALYIVWRRTMLGFFFGGYGYVSDDVRALLAALPQKLAEAWIGGTPGTVVVFLLGMLALALVRRPRAFGVAVLAMLAAVLPIAPVSTQMELRYAVIPWLAFVLIAMAGAASLPRRVRPLGAAAIVACLVLVAFVHASEWPRVYDRAMRMSAEARFYTRMAEGDVLRNPAVPPAALNETKWLKEERLRGPRNAGWSYDDVYFCNATPRRVFEYRGGSMTQVAPPACPTGRADAPLVAEFAFRNETLYWKLGPYPDGNWRFILADGVQAFDMPRTGGFHLGALPGITLRIRYESPEGWVTYTPPIALDFRAQPTMRWSRP